MPMTMCEVIGILSYKQLPQIENALRNSIENAIERYLSTVEMFLNINPYN